MVTVQFPAVIFTSGYWARGRKLYPIYKDKEGKKRRKIELAISEAIKEDYNIKADVVIGDYPAKKVKILSWEHTHPCILILCGFRGEKTDFEEYYSELLESIEIYEKREQSHMVTITKLLEENAELVKVNKKQLKEIADMVKTIEGKKDDKGDEEEEDSSGES